MSVVSDNIAIIQTQAAALDTLIASFRMARAAIDAAELAIRQAQPGANHEAIAGRIRLALYAHALMVGDLNGNKPVATLASEAWSGIS